MHIGAVDRRGGGRVSSRSGAFAVDWRGRRQGVHLRGRADTRGARIDRVITAAGSAAAHRGAGRDGWNGRGRSARTSRFREWKQAARRSTKLRRPPGCRSRAPAGRCASTGVPEISGASKAGIFGSWTRASVLRVPAGKLAANATLNGISIGAANVPQTSLRLEGSTSGEAIPRSVEGRFGFSAGALEIGAPIAFTADLWNGTVQVPDQSVAVTQTITARLPRAIAVEFGGAGALSPIARSLQANADFHVQLPQLTGALGPADFQWNGLRASGAWDLAHGFGPLRLWSGWNTARIGELPGGFALKEVTKLHLATTGLVAEAPASRFRGSAFRDSRAIFAFVSRGRRRRSPFFPRTEKPLGSTALRSAA